MSEHRTEHAALDPRPPRDGWSLLWRASPLALAPQRLLIAFFAAIALMVVGSVFDSIAGDVPDLGHGVFATLSGSLIRGVGATAQGLVRLDLARASNGFAEGMIYAPIALVRLAPWRCVLLLAVLLPVWTLFGGAISRSVVMDAARGHAISVPESIAYALSRSAALLGSYLLPLGLIAMCAGLLWVFGAVLLTLPGVDIAGGVLYGVALLVGLALSLLSLGLAVGFPLLIPAVAADSADITDAFQRAYAYLIERPFSLLVWAVALIAQGAAGVFITAIVVTTAVNWSADLTGAAEAGLAGDARLFAPLQEHDGLEGTAGVAAGAIGVWERAAVALIGAHALSFFFAASSLVYLRVRRACDGQAIEDVWPRITAVESVRRGDMEAIADTHDA